MLASAYYTSAYLNWSEHPLADFAKAAEIARTAVDLDPNLAEGYVILTYCALIMRDFALSEQMGERALGLNPCGAYAWYSLGLVHLYRGRFGKAITHFERVQRLNSSDPMIWIFYLAMSMAQFLSEDYVAALDYASRARAHGNGRWAGSLIGCAALVKLDRPDEARAIVAEYDARLADRWMFSLSRMPFEDLRLLSRFADPINVVAPGLLTISPASPAAEAPAAIPSGART